MSGPQERTTRPRPKGTAWQRRRKLWLPHRRQCTVKGAQVGLSPAPPQPCADAAKVRFRAPAWPPWHRTLESWIRPATTAGSRAEWHSTPRYWFEPAYSKQSSPKSHSRCLPPDLQCRLLQASVEPRGLWLLTPAIASQLPPRCRGCRRADQLRGLGARILPIGPVSKHQ